MEHEVPFLRALKSAALAMIRNAVWRDQHALPKEFAQIINAFEIGDWRNFTPEQKQSHIESLHRFLNVDPGLRDFFQQYPHSWTKDKFTALKGHLDNYYQELKAELGTR